MKFRVKAANGTESEVELNAGAVLGRERVCDFVLEDSRCSRRHAVIDADGVTVRDTNSANGIYVNGRKVASAVLKPGDVLRAGDTELTLMAEDSGSGTLVMESGTMAMGAQELAALKTPTTLEMKPASVVTPAAAAPTPAPPPPAAPPAAPVPAPTPAAAPPAPPAPAPAATATPAEPTHKQPRPSAAPKEAPQKAVSRGPIPRPLTVTLIGLAWGVCVLLYGAGGVIAGLRGTTSAFVFGPLLAVISGVASYGLLSRARWARPTQVVLAALGLFTPFLLPSAAILMYMLREDVGIVFSGRRDYGELDADEAETLGESRDGVFIGLIAAGLAVTVLVGGGLALILR